MRIAKSPIGLLIALILISLGHPSLSSIVNVYDMANKPATLDTYDEEIFVATVQGIVNRDHAKLFVVRDSKTDTAYLSQLSGTDGTLAGAVFEKLADLDAFVRQFKRDVSGLCVWDPDVPATLNVAITAAGADNLGVVRFDQTPGSLYDRLVTAEHGPNLPVTLNLVGKFKGEGRIPDTEIESTGSKKCDAYLWAKARYLDTGKAGPSLLYNCDGYRVKLFDLSAADQKLFQIIAALNLDVPIAQRAFAFDLSPFDDEFPKDDYTQKRGEDARTMRLILAAAAKSAKGALVQVLGFPHLQIKYCDLKTGSYWAGGKHTPREFEAQFVKMLSSNNAYLTGSSQTDNANFSVYGKLSKPKRMPQNPGLSEENLVDSGCLKLGKVTDRTFLTLIVAGYDDLSAVFGDLLPRVWQDRQRGSIPLSWEIDPGLVDFFPNGIKKLLDTRSKIDYFVAPASGAGYVNPGFLGDALSLWTARCKKYYDLLDYTITGNLANGLAGPLSEKVLSAFAEFSPTGIVTQEGIAVGDKVLDYTLIGKTPVIKAVVAPLDLEEAADAIHNTRPTKLPNFIAVRCPGASPTFLKSLLTLIQDERPDRNYSILDPIAFFDLLGRYLKDTPASK